MKKIICILLIAVTLFCFASCGNMSLGIGNYEFKRVHIDTHNYSGCLTVETWYEATAGIEVKTKEAGAIYLSEGTYIMIANECPFCEHLTNEGGEAE